MNKNWWLILFFASFLIGCSQRDSRVPVVGFIDAFEDNTIEQAKIGFVDALSQGGFDEQKGTLKIIYRNAQSNIPTLTQIVNYCIAQKVALIATNPSLSTITAVQNTKEIPIFMMVSPTPELMKVNDAQGHAPSNLFGVAESLGYIDTSFLLIPKVITPASGSLTVGMLYNQSEPQSVESLERIKHLAATHNIKLVYQSVNSSADVTLIAASLLAKDIDVFFANPDNIVFASFESILQACNLKHIPIFTSEAGLVQRGAVAAYGADIYQWGYQAGLQAASFLKTGSLDGLKWEMVQLRKKVFNPASVQKFGLQIPEDFEPVQ